MAGPVFVVGTPRSGTTLTARMLGAHPNIFVGGETHFFSDVYERRESLGDPGDPECRKRIVRWLAGIYERHNEPDDQRELDELFADPALAERLYRAASYRELYGALMELRAARAGKERWGNHVPKDVYYTKEIFSFFPDARLIVCVRDPRDFLASYRDRARVTAPGYQERLARLYHPVVTSLLWKSTARLILRLQARLPAERLLLLRYEDLVTEPERWVRRICDHLGEPYSARMLEVTGHNSSSATQGAGIFGSSVRRWRMDLSPEAVYLAQRIVGEEMQRFGYRIAPMRANRLAVAGLLATTPVAALRALHETRADRGGIVPYLIKRVRPYLQGG